MTDCASQTAHVAAQAAASRLDQERVGHGLRRSARTLGHVVVLALLSAVLTAVVIFVVLDGWTYYSTPLRVRGYHSAHSLLRPSGGVGRALGIAGTGMMLGMQLYSLRKRKPRLLSFGSIPAWLEFHIFCGILGPILITLHTSFKFNGIVSIAFWSMILVMLSGFIGRYLYVRIPRTIRGQEMTLGEMEQRAAELKQRILETTLPVDLLLAVEDFEAVACRPPAGEPTIPGLIVGDLLLRFRVAGLKERIRLTGFRRDLLERAVDLIRERAILLRRIAYLRRTRRLFELWHVFHRPLAVVMLVIVVLHVGTALYFGYAFFRG